MADKYLKDADWTHRVKEFFNLLDFNKNGVIQQEDWELWVNNMEKQINSDPHLIGKLRETTREYFAAIGIKEETQLTCEEFIKAFSEFTVREQAKLQRGEEPLLYPWNNSVYDVADTNHDGFITLDEYRKLLVACNLPESAADDTFKVIDKNNDGKIDRDKLNKHEFMFWFTTGAHEAKGMFGEAFKRN